MVRSTMYLHLFRFGSGAHWLSLLLFSCQWMRSIADGDLKFVAIVSEIVLD